MHCVRRPQEPWNVEDLSDPPDQHGGKAAPAEFVTPHLVGYDATSKTETEAAKPYFHLTISLKTPRKGPETVNSISFRYFSDSKMWKKRQ